jgi:hypothetical protein
MQNQKERVKVVPLPGVAFGTYTCAMTKNNILGISKAQACTFFFCSKIGFKQSSYIGFGHALPLSVIVAVHRRFLVRVVIWSMPCSSIASIALTMIFKKAILFFPRQPKFDKCQSRNLLEHLFALIVILSFANSRLLSRISLTDTFA